MRALVGGAFAFVVLSAARVDASILFDFNSLGAGINSTNGSDSIETYMENIYGSNITVVRGARTRKSRIEDRPSGLYLGNSDYATDRDPFALPPGHPNPKDTFLINRWNSSLPADEKDRIVIIFEDVPVTAVSFDWEIFPVTVAGANADFTFKADGITYFYHELTNGEKPLGDLGHFSIVFTSPVKKLEFIDWTDAPVGIDNLEVTRAPTPGSLALLATGVVTVSVRSRRRKRKSAA